MSACSLDGAQLAGASLARTADPACYWIESKLTGFVLDIDQGNPAQGAKLIVWPKHSPQPSLNQQWTLVDKGSGDVAIQTRRCRIQRASH